MHKIEYDRSLSPEQMAQCLGQFVNCLGYNKETNEFVDAVMREHRTLQQAIFGLFCQLVTRWASETNYDARNEYTVKTCKEMLDKFPNLKYRGPLI